jgi:hypothetical protein
MEETSRNCLLEHVKGKKRGKGGSRDGPVCKAVKLGAGSIL